MAGGEKSFHKAKTDLSYSKDKINFKVDQSLLDDKEAKNNYKKLPEKPK